MTSLTESALLNEILENKINNTYGSNNNKNNNTWYDCVYLCVENKDEKQVIGHFDCYPFETYEKAIKNSRHMYQYKNIRHTMIPMCKWIPKMFHSYFLNKSLQNIYWKGVNIRL